MFMYEYVMYLNGDCGKPANYEIIAEFENYEILKKYGYHYAVMLKSEFNAEHDIEPTGTRGLAEVFIGGCMKCEVDARDKINEESK